MKVFVVTGASSSGKTTLIEHLRERGFPVAHEVARRILAEGALHPRKNPAAFQEETVRRQLTEEEALRAQGGEIGFLDRGLYDIAAFCKHFNVQNPPAALERGADYGAAFILESLPQFEHDGVRIESGTEEATHIKNLIVDEYKKRGVPCVRVPLLPPAERAEFVLQWAHGNRSIENTEEIRRMA
ncbi:MAG: hypothetical protein A2945_02075 [Candidatus Liptonbacteria bacterium RIFCSPLOWO2_01_FULL_52_25]|uniref:NadR/Ttd14 AAA domain-containing protein n=1 Tax=Candidatus Liptonbacteria bacterium RIFCSPLOWO2_01_FULL_52_25 TaxID=1798650 RepID=A0A1G2CEX8_9BACT|nr:MAG: hypothetical protein A2945_02075 [Candidatus Liptonbacteria bacterium RIFCSPLOWO2_01_FULL_52_25]